MPAGFQSATFIRQGERLKICSRASLKPRWSESIQFCLFLGHNLEPYLNTDILHLQKAAVFRHMPQGFTQSLHACHGQLPGLVMLELMRNDPCVKFENMVTCFPLGFSSKEQGKKTASESFGYGTKQKTLKTWWKPPISGHLQENEHHFIFFGRPGTWWSAFFSFVEHIPNICWYIYSMFNTYSTSISYWLFICVDGRLTSPPSCCSISGKIVHIETQKHRKPTNYHYFSKFFPNA